MTTYKDSLVAITFQHCNYIVSGSSLFERKKCKIVAIRKKLPLESESSVEFPLPMICVRKIYFSNIYF